MSLNKVISLEIEIFSKCNRICNWCPNSIIDRKSKNIYMSEKIYLEFLRDINKEIHDKENLKLSYSRYNEPFLDIELLKKRVNQARDIIPNIILECNTNGDVLEKKGEEVLEGLNLDILAIMDYDCKGVEYGKELFNKCGIRTLTNSECKGYYSDFKDKEHVLLGTHKNIGLIKYHANWPKTALIQGRAGALIGFGNFENKEIISNYGGKGEKLKFIKPHTPNTQTGFINPLLGDNRRKEPCSYPTTGIFIDYNGSVTPCCNIRSDVDMHKDFILGNINEDSIKNIFNSKKATEFRETLKSKDWKKYPLPCKYCMSRCSFGEKPKTGGENKVKLVQNIRQKNLEKP
tara:strand:- start:22 stop:1059 length:1038 start_codon:yes stop_codon:yes gene_type:complete